MVKTIDIHTLNLEELTGVISLYPWYGAARMELCARMAGMGALSDVQIAETALHVGSRRKLFELARKGQPVDWSDKDNVPAGPASATTEPEERRIFIAGGDYFSQSQYEKVVRPDDNIFSRFAVRAREEGYKDANYESSIDDICTETLAQIYLEQDYPEQAINIYSKLSLRYPEKSVYFAALIDEINKKTN